MLSILIYPTSVSGIVTIPKNYLLIQICFPIHVRQSCNLNIGSVLKHYINIHNAEYVV